LGGRGRWIYEFEASLVYRVSSSTARATQRNPVLEKKRKKERKKNKEKKKKKRKKKIYLFYVSTLQLPSDTHPLKDRRLSE
jgi:hypothetical protein